MTEASAVNDASRNLMKATRVCGRKRVMLTRSSLLWRFARTSEMTNRFAMRSPDMPRTQLFTECDRSPVTRRSPSTRSAWRYPAHNQAFGIKGSDADELPYFGADPEGSGDSGGCFTRSLAALTLGISGQPECKC